jgi:hypothetical protein
MLTGQAFCSARFFLSTDALNWPLPLLAIVYETRKDAEPVVFDELLKGQWRMSNVDRRCHSLAGQLGS